MRTVKADCYNKAKENMQDMYQSIGMKAPAFDLTPVDLNYAYVPMEVTKASKDSDADMNKASECNLERFGLNKY